MNQCIGFVVTFFLLCSANLLFSHKAFSAQHNNNLVLGFDENSGQINHMQACFQGCENQDSPLYKLDFQAGQPALIWRLTEPLLASQLSEVSFVVQRQPVVQHPGWLVTSSAFQDGRRLQFHYQFGESAFSLRTNVVWLDPMGMQLADMPPVHWRLQIPSEFERGTSGGFADSHEKIQWTHLKPNGWQLASEIKQTDAGQWIGIRNRFWALLANPSRINVQNQVVEFAVEDTPLVFYIGPLEQSALSKASPELTGLLFTDLWFWIRWLSLAILLCLNTLADLFGHWGMAVLVLSLVVKIAMTPLTAVAERWQRQVNQIQSKLVPEIREIKKHHKGEEQTRRIMALHQEHGVSLFYPLKSAFGFLIQIPVFIAAFNVLNECFGLNGAGFLFIADLAKPDHWLSLPFTLPFFGAHLNLMPVLMTGITLLASSQFHDPSLSSLLKKRQQRQLYMMAFLFLVLFYTFPAGMVLYWTTNNLVQYVKDSVLKLRFQVEQTS